MPYFLNPFAKHDVSEFEGVYEPLSQARRSHSVVSEKSPATDKVDPEKGSDAGSRSDEPQIYNADALEGLRAEIDSDIAASGHDSVYDRMF